MTAVVCIVGASGSGKTTLMEAVIAGLAARGRRVGTIKHDVHGFQMDHEGKDTWRHKKAGASFVLISSPEKLAYIADTGRDIPLPELLRAYGAGVDVVLVEGYKADTTYPKIEVHRASIRPGLLCGPRDHLCAVVGDPVPGLSVPHFSWNDTEGVISFIERVLLSA